MRGGATAWASYSPGAERKGRMWGGRNRRQCKGILATCQVFKNITISPCGPGSQNQRQACADHGYGNAMTLAREGLRMGKAIRP